MLHPIDPLRAPSTDVRRFVGRPPRQRRRHASSADGSGRDGRDGLDEAYDRSVLERAGWRTTLDYRENHRRGPDGVLTAVEPRWRGDAERSGPDGALIVFSAVGPTPVAVWRRLRVEAEAIDHASPSRGADQRVRGRLDDPRQFSRQRLARAE